MPETKIGSPAPLRPAQVHQVRQLGRELVLVGAGADVRQEVGKRLLRDGLRPTQPLDLAVLLDLAQARKRAPQRRHLARQRRAVGLELRDRHLLVLVAQCADAGLGDKVPDGSHRRIGARGLDDAVALRRHDERGVLDVAGVRKADALPAAQHEHHPLQVGKERRVLHVFLVRQQQRVQIHGPDELRDLLQSVHVQRPPAVCFFAGSFRQSSTARAKCHPLPDFPANRVRGVEKAENPYKKCRIWCKLFEKIDAFCEDPPFHAAAVVL